MKLQQLPLRAAVQTKHSRAGSYRVWASGFIQGLSSTLDHCLAISPVHDLVLRASLARRRLGCSRRMPSGRSQRSTLGVCATARAPDHWADPKSPPQGSAIYTMRVLESRIGGSTFWILQRVWVVEAPNLKPLARAPHDHLRPTQQSDTRPVVPGQSAVPGGGVFSPGPAVSFVTRGFQNIEAVMALTFIFLK